MAKPAMAAFVENNQAKTGGALSEVLKKQL